MSARLAASREPPSKNTRVARMGASSSRKVRRAALLGGGKPANRNRSVGRPAADSPASRADAPGIGKTGRPAAAASRTSR